LTQGRVCTQKLLRTEAFTHRRVYTGVFTHGCVYTQKPPRTDAFTQSSFYTEKPLITQRSLDADKLVQGFYREKSFAPRSLYTEELLHREVFLTQRRFTQRKRSLDTPELLHREALTQRRFTQKLLHTNTFTHSRFYK